MTPAPGEVTLRHDPDIEVHAEALAARLVSRRLLGEYADPAVARAVAHEAAESVVVHGRRYEIDVDAVVPHGHVVLVGRDHPIGSALESGQDTVVVDLKLDDVSLASEVCLRVEEVAARTGARRLAIALPPGDLVRTAFVVGAGFRPVTSQLRLDLDHDLPVEDRVVLRAVTTADSGAESPPGPDPPDQHLFVGHDRETDVVVGTVRVSTERPMVLVRDVRVPVGRRGRGHGSGLLRAITRWSQERGSHAVGVDLRADDHVARGLVDHVGFHLVEEYCVKDLPPRGRTA